MTSSSIDDCHHREKSLIIIHTHNYYLWDNVSWKDGEISIIGWNRRQSSARVRLIRVRDWLIITNIQLNRAEQWREGRFFHSPTIHSVMPEIFRGGGGPSHAHRHDRAFPHPRLMWVCLVQVCRWSRCAVRSLIYHCIRFRTCSGPFIAARLYIPSKVTRETGYERCTCAVA